MAELTMEMVGTFCIVLFVLISALVSVWSAVKVVREMRAPGIDREKRIEALERRADENATHISDLNAATKLMLKSNSVMIEHLKSGGHEEELDKMAQELNQYLWNHLDG